MSLVKVVNYGIDIMGDSKSIEKFEKECSLMIRQGYVLKNTHTVYIPRNGSVCDQYIDLFAIMVRSEGLNEKLE